MKILKSGLKSPNLINCVLILFCLYVSLWILIKLSELFSNVFYGLLQSPEKIDLYFLLAGLGRPISFAIAGTILANVLLRTRLFIIWYVLFFSLFYLTISTSHILFYDVRYEKYLYTYVSSEISMLPFCIIAFFIAVKFGLMTRKKIKNRAEIFFIKLDNKLSQN